jgi:hypothetical protein
MFGLNALDVAIGLAFVYLLLSLICTAVNEWIASIFKWRGNTLRDGIEVLLSGDTARAEHILNRIYQHPLVQSLFKGKRLPSYMPPRTFALALMQSVALPPEPGAGAASDLESRFLQGVDALEDSHLKRSLQALLPLRDSAKAPLEGTLNLLETWFNDTMDRTSGWYKRKSQVVSVILAIIVTLVVNADTLKMVRQLWTNPALREQIVAEAKACVEKAQPGEQTDFEYTDPDNPDPAPPIQKIREACVDKQKSEQLLGQLTGWDDDRNKWNELWQQASAGKPPGISPDISSVFWDWLGYLLFNHLAGWIVTAIALTLGAQFWFERLKEFVKLRGAGKALLTEPAQPAARPGAPPAQ